MDAKGYIPNRLNGFVKNIWEVESGFSENYCILPDGYIYLVFNFSTNFDGVKGKLIQSYFDPTKNFCFLSGMQMTAINFLATSFHAITVEMHPVAAQAIFGIPCSELKNYMMDGSLVLNNFNELEDKLQNLETFIEKARWIEDYLYNKINENSELITVKKMHAVLDKMQANLFAGNSIGIENFTGYSKRHVHRLSEQWLGLSPARHMKLQQFIKAIEQLHFSDNNFTKIAANNGFYDQTHFNRSFREYADMTPTQYKGRKSKWVGHILS